MFVKMDFARGRIAFRRHRLGDVVQQSRPRQRRMRARRQFFQHQADVIEHAAFGVIIRRLLARNRRRQFGQDVFQQAAVAQQNQAARGVWWLKQFHQFIPHAFGADEFDFWRERFDGRKRLRLDLKIQLRRKAHGAQQPQMILAKAFLRRTDGADDFGAEILLTADPVVDFFRERVVEKPVDREIAALCVGLGIGENHRFRAATILVIRLGAKGGDLELLSALDHDHHAELAAHGDGAPEKFLNLLRLGVRGDVVITRFAPEQTRTRRSLPPATAEQFLWPVFST